MSSHWGAVSGVALRLNNKDFNNMVETYLQKTYLPDATESDMEEFWDKIENDIGTISEFPFLRSKYRTESMKKLPTLDSCFQKTESELKDLFEHRILYRICCFDQYNTDIHEGGTFHPINNDPSFDGILRTGKEVEEDGTAEQTVRSKEEGRYRKDSP